MSPDGFFYQRHCFIAFFNSPCYETPQKPKGDTKTKEKEILN
jgi:hypothetical protein